MITLSKLPQLSLFAAVIAFVLIAAHTSNAFTLYDGHYVDPRSFALDEFAKRGSSEAMFKRAECGCGLGCFYSSARGCAACCSLGL